MTPRTQRPFRYLTVPKPDREGPYLARELVRCGKARCRCVHGAKHGPYFYLRYLQWDVTACGVHFVHFRREYVPKTEVERVRRWIRRYRAENTLGRALLGLVARYARQRRDGPI